MSRAIDVGIVPQTITSQVKNALRMRRTGSMRFRLISAASVFAGLAIWEIVSDVFIKDPLFLASPVQIVIRFFQMLQGADGLWLNMAVSGEEFAIGMGVSIIIGVPVGLAVALIPSVAAALQPWISALYSTPAVALAPLFILWFGLGLTGKVVVVVLVAVFPIIINTQAGVVEADKDLIEMARVLGLRGLRLFSQIHLRSALPLVLTGIRLAIGKAVIGVVVAELFGARAGLGYQITVSSQSYDTAGLFAAVAVLAVGGVLITAVVHHFENRLSPWQH